MGAIGLQFFQISECGHDHCSVIFSGPSLLNYFLSVMFFFFLKVWCVSPVVIIFSPSGVVDE